jgi:periplasmic protein TonB
MSAALSADLSTSYLAKHRIIVIACAVLAFHALAIWALQSGLLMRAVEMVVPVEVLAQIIEPPKPVVPPPPPPVVPKEPPPVPKQAVIKPAPPVPKTQAPPQILAVETPTPAPNAPAQVQIAPPAPILPPSVPVAAEASPAPTPAPTPVPAPAVKVAPSTDADDLYNPNQRYPRMSLSMGEQGSVMVRILIGANGLPKKAELQKSSGFERLDQAALEYVMQSRYKPGTLNGVPNEMWMGRTVTYTIAK